MKTYRQFIREAKKPSYLIYCDLDGVLVDFIGGIMNKLRISREPYQDEIDDFLSTLEGSSWKWWSKLEWTDNGKKLWNTLKDLNTEILSACPNKCTYTPNVVKGKKMWVNKNLKLNTGINITTRKGKKKFVGERTILIDDYIKNINEWKAAGGIGIHYRGNPQATIKELTGHLADLSPELEVA